MLLARSLLGYTIAEAIFLSLFHRRTPIQFFVLFSYGKVFSSPKVFAIIFTHKVLSREPVCKLVPFSLRYSYTTQCIYLDFLGCIFLKLFSNLDKALTKSSRSMYDLSRSCQEFRKLSLFWRGKKAQKEPFWYKRSSKRKSNIKKVQELPRILSRIGRNREKRWDKITSFKVIVNTFRE